VRCSRTTGPWPSSKRRRSRASPPRPTRPRNICQRLDRLIERGSDDDPPLTARAFATGLATEIDRLDGYTIYQVELLQSSLELLQSSLERFKSSIAVELESLPRQVLPSGSGIDAIVPTPTFDIVIPTREAGLLAFLARHGTKDIEPGVTAALRSLLRPGDVAIDGGANVGLHALTMAAAVGAEGKVVCFEPIPHIAEALIRTLRLNGFGDRCEVRRAALADHAGEVDLFVAPHSPLTSLFPLPAGAGAETVAAMSETLDDVLPQGSRMDLVKLDIEGAEPSAWRGMRRLRRENARLAIVLEWSASHFARSGESAAAFMSEILADGFRPFVIADDDSATLLPFGDADVETLEAKNLLLLRGRG
jgi:FkbM family methyltransferase